MKKKIVIKLSMNCEKCRSMALHIAARTSCVELVALKGQDKNRMEVVGDEIDPVDLTRRLRKKFAHAELESVSEVKEEKKPGPKSDGAAKTTSPTPCYVVPPCYAYPHCYCCEVMTEPSICTIM